MDRRTFVLLTGAASATLIRPARGVGRSVGRSAGRLRFELDDRRRWSLWYYGDGRPLALIQDAVVGAWVGDQLVTLAELEDSTVGTRRPPGGEAVAVRGRAAGVYMETEFLTGGDAEAPQAAVAVTIYPDRYLPTVKGIRFFQATATGTLVGDGPLIALANGYQSGSPCRIVTLSGSEASELVSHGALGLTRGDRGLALAFDPGEPGEAKVKLSRDGLEAVSDWLPPRPLRPEGDTSRMRLSYRPAGDGLEALTALFLPTSPLDRERLASVTAPAGWCSRSEPVGGVTEADVIANLEFCAANFDRRFFRYIHLDEGYQKAAGDWQTNDRFPRGHRWLTDQIHGKGFKAGLWVAPFAVGERSGVPAEHPDWLLKHAPAEGPIVWDTRDDWGGKVYSLDGAHPQVQQWLFDLARRAVRDWGYDCLEIDFLHWATAGESHYGGLTHAEAYRRGLAAIRDGLGTEAFLLGSGAPLQHAVGYVNGMRIGSEAEASWSGLQAPARAAGLRSFYHRATWLNDPAGFVVQSPLSAAEAQVWTSLVALTGGVTLSFDNLPTLPPERVAWLARTLPVAPTPGRPVETQTAERDVAPAIVAADDVYPINGPWRLRTGDDPLYSRREFDEEAWETTAVPKGWEEAGHPEYNGFAWYRVRFALPPTPPRPPTGRSGGQAVGRSVFLELGKIDDADETFLNGVKIGQTGDFPPNYRSERHAYRRYAVPAGLPNWGGENVLAVRVYDARGAGGIWSTRRERPPARWVVEGSPRWWTVALVNWDDEPQQVAVALAPLGIPGDGGGGATFNAYDVWRDAPLPDLKDTLAATLDPHSTLTVAIRAASARPQVIGTTRHIVQGAVDISDETWSAETRTLRAKSINLDSRRYAVTIALPKAMRPGTCKADIPCTVRRLQSGHAVLEWPAGGDGRDIRWELSVRPASRR